MAFFLLAVWMLQGYAHAQTPADPIKGPEIIHNILLLTPYDMCRLFGENASLTGPLSGKVFVTTPVAAEATDIIYVKLKKTLSTMQHLELTTVNKEAGEAMVGIVPINGDRRERFAAIQRLGRKNRVDGVFCAYIYGFQERVGSAYAAESPASVSFELNLVNVADGRMVWQSHFTETQKTLSENVLNIGQFLKRKGSWVTAERMATDAVDKMMKSFPYK